MNDMIYHAQKNKVIYFLIGIYLSGLLKEVPMLVNFRQQPDYLLFESNHLGFEFLMVLLFLTILDRLTVWLMLRQHPAGFWLAIIGTILKRVEEYFVLTVSVNHFELLKELYIQKRLSRGLPIDETSISVVLNQTFLTIVYGFMCFLSVVIVMLLIWKKDYFFERGRKEKERAKLLDELQAIGFYRYIDSTRIEFVKRDAIQTGYLYDDSGRSFWADSEDLAEGGIGGFLMDLQPFLEKQGVTIDIGEEIVTDEKYELYINNNKWIFPIDHENFEENEERVSMQLFSSINQLLERAGSKERIYSLYGGNDQYAIFLTKEMFEKIKRYKEILDELPREIR